MTGTEASGARPAAGLAPVREEQAAPEVQAVFAEIARTLRVPFAGLFWRTLAADALLFQAAWQAVAANLRTWAAERAADHIRDRALIVEAAEMSSHQAFKGDLVRAEIDYDLRNRINNFNHIAYYALPKHLLAVTMLSEALAGRPPAGSGDTAEIPPGIAEGAVPVSPLDPAMARGRAAELLPVVAAGHGHPEPEDYFRSLARLPDYLGAAWNALRPIVRDEEYDARGRELATIAQEAVASLPHRVLLNLDGEQRQQLAGLLSLFRATMLPDTLLDAAIITVLTDGPDHGGRCAYVLTSSTG